MIRHQHAFYVYYFYGLKTSKYAKEEKLYFPRANAFSISFPEPAILGKEREALG
jgi:hypothetical protein